jgi:hypothetical protein
VGESERVLRALLPIILTLRWIPPAWVAFTIAMEDDLLRDHGFGTQMGLFAARFFGFKEVVTRYDGDTIGVFVEDSAAYARAVERALRDQQQSFIFEVDGPRANLVRLWSTAPRASMAARDARTLLVACASTADRCATEPRLIP